MDPEIKALFDKTMSTFEEFKAVNDRLGKEVAKLGEGDVITKAALERIDKEIDDIAKKWAGRVDDVEKKVNRLAMGGNGGPPMDEEVKAAAIESQAMGRDVSPQQVREYRKAFGDFVRRGHDCAPETKALVDTARVNIDPGLGYLVPVAISARIITRAEKMSPMRTICAVETIGTGALEGGIDRDEMEAAWGDEITPPPDTKTPTIGKYRIETHTLLAKPKATTELLEDATRDIEQWIADKAGRAFARAEASGFLFGNTPKRPRGLLTYSYATTADGTRPWETWQYLGTGTSGGFGSGTNGSDKLIELVHMLDAAYVTNARWQMSRATLGACRRLKNGDGTYVWLPDMQSGPAGLLLGYPVAINDWWPDIGASQYAIGFGDWREAYTIVDRAAMTMLRDPYTADPLVKFSFRRRTGGGATNFDAAKFLQFA